MTWCFYIRVPLKHDSSPWHIILSSTATMNAELQSDFYSSWRHHVTGTSSVFLTRCVGNPGKNHRWPWMRPFDISFDGTQTSYISMESGSYFCHIVLEYNMRLGSTAAGKQVKLQSDTFGITSYLADSIFREISLLNTSIALWIEAGGRLSRPLVCHCVWMSISVINVSCVIHVFA